MSLLLYTITESNSNPFARYAGIINKCLLYVFESLSTTEILVSSFNKLYNLFDSSSSLVIIAIELYMFCNLLMSSINEYLRSVFFLITTSLLVGFLIADTWFNFKILFVNYIISGEDLYVFNNSIYLVSPFNTCPIFSKLSYL